MLVTLPIRVNTDLTLREPRLNCTGASSKVAEAGAIARPGMENRMEVAAALELSGIGLMMGLSGPCLLTCAPPLVLYFSGLQQGWRLSLLGLVLFLLGRVLVYTLLGGLAGLSATALQQHLHGPLLLQLRVIVGLVIIAMGVLVWRDRAGASCGRHGQRKGATGLASLFFLGLVVGLSPCPPLVAVLLEIVMVVKSAMAGFAYGFAFAAGTFLSGLVAIGAMIGLVRWLPRRLFACESRYRTAFVAGCALLLVALGTAQVVGGLT